MASANATFDSKVESIDYASYTGNSVAYNTAVVNVDTSSTADNYPGMQATVTIPKEEVKDVVLLKMDAVSTAMDNSAFVYLQQADGTMKEQPITVGVSNGNYVEVKEGLGDGSHEVGYESLLFDSGKVHTIDITMKDWSELDRKRHRGRIPGVRDDDRRGESRECKDSKAFGCFNRTLFLVLQQRMRQHCGVCTCIVTVNVSALW